MRPLAFSGAPEYTDSKESKMNKALLKMAFVAALFTVQAAALFAESFYVVDRYGNRYRLELSGAAITGRSASGLVCTGVVDGDAMVVQFYDGSSARLPVLVVREPVVVEKPVVVERRMVIDQPVVVSRPAQPERIHLPLLPPGQSYYEPVGLYYVLLDDNGAPVLPPAGNGRTYYCCVYPNGLSRVYLR